MTLANAIRELMGKGITDFVGWTAQAALENALRCDEDAAKHSKPENAHLGAHEWAKYHIEHADDNFIVEADGHHIIATWYESNLSGTRFCLATYGDYKTEDEMVRAFDEWKIAKEAGEIADEMMAKRPGEFPREVWVEIASSELRAAYKAADISFKKEFGSESEENGQRQEA